MSSLRPDERQGADSLPRSDDERGGWPGGQHGEWADRQLGQGSRDARPRVGHALVVPNRRRALIGAVSSLLTFTTIAATVMAGPAAAVADAGVATADTTGADPSQVAGTATTATTSTTAPADPTLGATTTSAPTTANSSDPAARTTSTVASAPSTSPATTTPSAPGASGTTTAAPAQQTRPGPPATGTSPASGPSATDQSRTAGPAATDPAATDQGRRDETPSPPTGTTTTTSLPDGAARPGTVSGTVIQAPINFEPRPGEVAPVAELPQAATKAPEIGAVVALPADDRPLDPVAGAAQLASFSHAAARGAHHHLDSLAAEATAIDDQLVVVSATVQALTERAFLVPATQAGPVVAQRQAAMAAQQQLGEARALVQMQLVMTQDEVVADDLAHDDARTRLAKLVGDRLGAGLEGLDTMWKSSAPARLDVVYAALAQVGDPYIWAAVGPDAFDCSGLTMFAWATVGVHLTHYTHAQRAQTLDAAPDQLQPGDLIYNLSADGTGHVMLSLGLDHAMVEAPRPGTTVQLSRWHDATGFGSPLDDRPAVLAAESSTPAG